jgi:pimeloyl-ACP methyl ester carboxylesterase
MNRHIALAALALLSTPALAASETDQVARSDGSLIHYTLDRPIGEVSGLLLLSQGSGCRPGTQSPGLATVRAAFPTYAALIVEKAGIAPEMTVDELNCPAEFYDRYTVTQRIDDYQSVLSALPAIPGRLILFGGSEGGLAVAILSTRLDPDATIIFSSATGTSFGEMVKSTVPSEGHASIDAGFAAARANPDSSELFAGHAYRFWADILDHRTLDYIGKADTPFLLIQGGLDTSSPLAAARVTADAFAAAGHCNLTYWEFPALDHGMVDPRGNAHLADIAALAAAWVEHPVRAC